MSKRPRDITLELATMEDIVQELNHRKEARQWILLYESEPRRWEFTFKNGMTAASIGTQVSKLLTKVFVYLEEMRNNEKNEET